MSDSDFVEAPDIANHEYDLRVLSCLLLPGVAGLDLGFWIMRVALLDRIYSGLCTSDLSGWRCDRTIRKVYQVTFTTVLRKTGCPAW